MAVFDTSWCSLLAHQWPSWDLRRQFFAQQFFAAANNCSSQVYGRSHFFKIVHVPWMRRENRPALFATVRKASHRFASFCIRSHDGALPSSDHDDAAQDRGDSLFYGIHAQIVVSRRALATETRPWHGEC